MKKNTAQRKKLITDPDHVLLNIRELLDLVLMEAGDLPPDVKQALIQARDLAWKAFIENVNHSSREGSQEEQ